MFMDHVHVHFGLPTHILSDRGTQFTGVFNQTLADRLGYSWKLTTAHTAWSDGQTERTNRFLEDVLRHFVSADMRDWDTHLSHVQFAMNDAWQESVQETPFFLNRGRHPKSPLTVNLPDRPVINPAAGEFADHIRSLIARTRRCMLAAQQRQKRYYDERRTDAAFSVGTKVLLSTANLALKVLTTGTRKLAPKWVGPFTITERIGPLGYKLDLPDSMKVHDEFHVSFLKLYHADGRVQPPPIPELIDNELEFEVDKILNHRLVKGRQRKLEYLLRFTGYGPEHDMWLADMSKCPDLVQEFWDSKPVTPQRCYLAFGLSC